MNYIKVRSKDLKKHGKLIGKELHLNEGVYCINSPEVDIESITYKKTKDVSTKN